ncbi:MAG TPA: hypothetical protein VK808_04690 [Bacteroidia bacterium]|nr:hypothetical protein [Bacteroidia bacterium]
MEPKNSKKLSFIGRTMLEVGFILFLFYSNLLMGEYTHSGMGHKNGLLWAIQDIFTWDNFFIAIVLALIGYLAIELLRKRF